MPIIDAGRNPEAKALFLSGQVNWAACPQCGRAGMLSIPLIYHDPSKELLLTFVPPELGASDREQQRVIGEMTNQLIAALPAEQRKGYLLRPRSYLRLEAMIETILEADGVTHEVLEAQRARSALLDRLVRTLDEAARRAIAEENDASIDYEFFQLLTMNLELAEEGGQDGAAQLLLNLHEQLLEWTTQGKEIAAREEAIQSLGQDVTREGLLEKLVDAASSGEQVKIETMVAVARPTIDYVFYQQLTARIESAERGGASEQARTLRALRDTILDLTAQIDAEVQRATETARQFLQQLLTSGDPETLMRANPRRVDGLFLDVLTTDLEAGARSGQADLVDRLTRIRDLVTKLIQESQPPEIQFINQLLGAPFPAGSRELLEANRQAIDEELLEVMALLADDLRTRGRTDMAERLEEIRNQAAGLAG